MVTDITARTHGETARLDVHELARQLVMHLGPTLVATLAGIKSRQMPHRWATDAADGGATPGPEPYRRLMVAHRIWTAISSAESDDTTRAWFIGANPRLGEQPPVLALRDGKYREVLAAAQAFLDGTDD